MNNYENYYSNIKGAKCHKNLDKLVDINADGLTAVELGCGSGRDTIYLIKKRI